MFKKFFFFFFFVWAGAFVFVQAGTSSEELESNMRDLSGILKTKFNITIIDDIMKLVEKVEQKCPDVESKIQTAAEQVAHCIEEIELGSDTFCQLIKKNYVKCSKPVRDIIVECVPEESKDLPAMGEKVTLALIERACSSTVEEILELFNPCIVGDEDRSEICDKLKETLTSHKHELPTKAFVCELIPKFKGCAKAELDANCKNQITKNAHLHFYESVEQATSDSCAALNQA